MNLAKYITWDSIFVLAVGTAFGLGVGIRFDNFVLGCVAFSGAQYLAYGFVYMNRIDRNLQLLILRMEVRKDLDAAIKALEEIRKEAARHADRG